MRIILDFPRLSLSPFGMQTFLEQVALGLRRMAPPDFEFEIYSGGVQGRTEHFARLQVLKLTPAFKTRWTPLPQTLLSHSIELLNLPTSRQLYGEHDLLHTFGEHWVPRHKHLVVTIQDLCSVSCNEISEEQQQIVLRRLTALCRGASKVTTISNFAARDIADKLSVPPENIEVIPNGCDTNTFTSAPAADDEAQRQVMGLTVPYLLVVGGLTGRKNLRKLLQALRLLKQDYDIPHKLAIIGPTVENKVFQEWLQAEKVTEYVITPGYQRPAAIAAAYRGADAFVFPSTYEGFGLPPLEAMSCGTPVAVSNAGALPEVVGDAGVYFDPYDVTDMAKQIALLVSDDQLKGLYKERGLLRATNFSWDSAAGRLLQIYREVLS